MEEIQRFGHLESTNFNNFNRTKYAKVGFEFGDKVDQILGARKINGELSFYVSWWKFWSALKTN